MWIFLGYLAETFWRDRLESIDCTLKEMDKAADGIFFIQLTEDGNADKRGIANITRKSSQHETNVQNVSLFD